MNQPQIDAVVFDASPLAAHLARVFGVRGEVTSSWRVADVYWARDAVLGVRLAHPTGSDLEVHVLRRDDARRAFRRATHVDVLYRRDPRAPELDPEAYLAVSRVADAVAELAAPAESPAERTAQEAPVATALNLAIEAPCGEKCAFCSVTRTLATRTDFDDADHARFLAALDRARTQGIAHLRVNGIDPLSYPRILEVFDHARAVAFERVDVFTTGQRLDDAGFAREMLARLPAQGVIHVPLYGSTPALHDELVGAAGAFARVLRGLVYVRDAFGAPRVRVTSVVMRQNLGDLGALRDLVRGLGVGFGVHLPYPNHGGADDPYADVAVQVSDAVRVLGALDPPIALDEAPPCVVQRVLGTVAHTADVDRTLRGRYYKSSSFVHKDATNAPFHAPALPCRHVDACALAAECPGMHYRAYLDRFGDAEFAPPGTSSPAPNH